MLVLRARKKYLFLFVIRCLKCMDIKELSTEQRKERRKIRKYLADVLEQRAKYAAIKLIREEKDVDEDTAENTVMDLFEALPVLRVKRNFIHGIAKWYAKGYFDYENKESCSRINALLKVAFNSIVTHNVYSNFYSGHIGRFLTPEDLKISLGMEFGEQKDIEFDTDRYSLKEIKSFDEIYELRELFPYWCFANNEEAYKSYTFNGKERIVLAFRDDYNNVKRIAGSNLPHDSYGYSIICMISDMDGNPFSTTSRWNSFDERDEFLSDSEAEELMKKAKRE